MPPSRSASPLSDGASVTLPLVSSIEFVLRRPKTFGNLGMPFFFGLLRSDGLVALTGALAEDGAISVGLASPIAADSNTAAQDVATII